MSIRKRRQWRKEYGRHVGFFSLVGVAHAEVQLPGSGEGVVGGREDPGSGEIAVAATGGLEKDSLRHTARTAEDGRYRTDIGLRREGRKIHQALVQQSGLLV